MSSALDRAIASLDRLIVLAPPYATIPSFFRYVPVEPSEHNHFLESVQRLRGNVYFEDGAITADELTSDGRHETPEDSRAWHLLMRARTGVTACVSYFEHEDASSVEELRVRKCPLNHTTDWRNTFRRAVEAELGRARRERLRYVELGGWAVAPTERHRGDGLLLALAAYSLGRAFGGSLGLTTATVRHASSTILRKLGGTSLEVDGTAVPAYYDSRYRCEMELLRFDSRQPNPKFAPVIERLMQRMSGLPVLVTSDRFARPAPSAVRVPAWQLMPAVGGSAA